MRRHFYIAMAMVFGIGVGVFSAYYFGNCPETVQYIYNMPKPNRRPVFPHHSVHTYTTYPPPKALKGSILKQKSVVKKFRPNPDTNCIVTIPPKYITIGDEPFIIPEEKELSSLPGNAVACLYHRYVTTLQYHCGYKDRFGMIARNGWYVCLDPSFAPKSHCVVFSSKIFNDNAFLYDITGRYSCRVFYTPLSDKKSLQSWIAKTNTSDNIIDILTLSISSYAELLIIDSMVEERSIGKVKQLLLELHFDPDVAEKLDYMRILKRLKMLFRAGLRIIWYDRPFECVSKNKHNKCYTIYFVQRSLVDRTHKYKELRLPSDDEILKMSGPECSDLYYKYLMTTQFFCQQIVRIGKILDGGWDVCHDMMLKIDHDPCITYSFGINNDFSFDDDMVKTYNCNVYSFDPTMNKETHKHAQKVWFHNRGIGNTSRKYANGNGDIAPLNKIRKDLDHVNVPIAVMKGDTEGAEWVSTPQMLDTNQLSDVSQFYLELHSEGHAPKRLLLLKRLHDAGFRVFWFHTNPECVFRYRNSERTFCMEVYFMNTRYPFTP